MPINADRPHVARVNDLEIASLIVVRDLETTWRWQVGERLFSARFSKVETIRFERSSNLLLPQPSLCKTSCRRTTHNLCSRILQPWFLRPLETQTRQCLARRALVIIIKCFAMPWQGWSGRWIFQVSRPRRSLTCHCLNSSVDLTTRRGLKRCYYNFDSIVSSLLEKAAQHDGHVSAAAAVVLCRICRDPGLAELRQGEGAQIEHGHRLDFLLLTHRSRLCQSTTKLHSPTHTARFVRVVANGRAEAF